MKKVYISVASVGIGLVVALFLFRIHFMDPASSPPTEYATSVTREPHATAREQRNKRVEEMMTRLAAIAATPQRPVAEKKTGWEDVPYDLDTMLDKERIDEEAGAKYLKYAENFLEKQQIDGTSILDVTCGQSLCRISFQHNNAEKFQHYRRQLYFAPWEGSSNYFSGAPSGDGSWKSFIWLGREGFILPLEELHQANASRL